MNQARAHRNGWFEYKRVTPIEACSQVKVIELLLKTEYSVTCLATMAYVNAACTVRVTTFSISHAHTRSCVPLTGRVTIFSIVGKFQTLPAHSCTFLH